MRQFFLFTCLLLAACQSVPTTSADASQAPAEHGDANAETKPAIDWLTHARQAQTIEAFIVAVNNLLLLGKQDEVWQLVQGPPLPAPSSTSVPAKQGSQLLGMAKRMRYFLRAADGVCPQSHDWTLLDVVPSSDGAQVFFHVDADKNGNIWCSFDIEEGDSGFRIVNVYNHYDEFSLADMYQAYTMLMQTDGVDLTMSKLRPKGLYFAMAGGFDAFDRYLARYGIDASQPAIRAIRLRLLDRVKDQTRKAEKLKYYVRPGGRARLFAVRQLFLNVDLGQDSALLLENLTIAEAITHDRSRLRSLMAGYLSSADDELAIELLNSAIIAEPTDTEAYATLFSRYNDQGHYGQAVTVLKLLAENFGYDFQRSAFDNKKKYAGLVKSSEFNQWLPAKQP